MKTITEVLERPLELAIIQERAIWLPENDEDILRNMSSLDDIQNHWHHGILSESLCVENSSRVVSGSNSKNPVILHKALQNVELVEERKGDQILMENSSFRPFHHDLFEKGHAIMNLLNGRKLWLFCKSSPTGKQLDVIARCRRTNFSDTIRYLQSLSKTTARQVSWCIIEPGCTLYWPYGYLHSVWTGIPEGTVCSLNFVERVVDAEFAAEQQMLAKYTVTGERRC